MPVALVRAPGPHLDQGLVSFGPRQAVDLDLAERQWHEYVAAMAAAGWRIVEVGPADDCPDAVFVEDPIVVYGGTAVLTRPGAPSRRGEVAAVRCAVSGLGLDVREIRAPGTLDGGDVLKVGSTVYVGRGGRTNAEGIRQLREILGAQGATVVAVPVTSVLHLKSAVTALPDGTVVGYRPLVDHVEVFPSFLEVAEESGAHVVVLDENRILMAADAPKSAGLFLELGYEPVTVDISEFQKLEGCVTCLSVRVRCRS
jgi:dimethylargininase